MRKKKLKWMLLLLALSVLWNIGTTTAQEERVLGPQHAILLVAQSLSQFDALLLSNGGMANGMVRNESFTFALEGSGTRTLSREEIDTLDLGFEERPLDRVLLKSGEVLQGRLQDEDFQVQLATGDEVLLPRASLRGLIFKIPLEEFGPLVPEPGQPIWSLPILRRLLDNPLADELIGSLTKYDWLLLRNNGLASGSVMDETLFFRSRDGQVTPLFREAISLILVGRRPGTDLIVLKTTGDRLIGVLEMEKFHVRLTHQPDSSTELAKDQLAGIFFRVTSLGSGGPPGP